MNSTILLRENLTNTIESWFIPMDILMIITVLLAIVVAIGFLCIIIADKTCHTVPMILVANTCITELFLSFDLVWIYGFTLYADLYNIQVSDSLCSFRGYLSYVTLSLQNCSYLLQAFYRCVIVFYPNRVFWKTARTQLCLIGLSWIYAFLFPFPLLINGGIIYHRDCQICQVIFRLHFPIFYIASCVYAIPVSLIIFIYLKLVLYTRMIGKRAVAINSLARARRELKMVSRILLLVTVLVTLGVPYVTFIIVSFFTTPPKYHLRIAPYFVNVSVSLILIILFQITDPLKASVFKKQNTIVPTRIMTIHFRK